MTVVDVASAGFIVLGLHPIIATVLKETGTILTLKEVFDTHGKVAITVACKVVNDTQAISLLIKEALNSFAAVQPSLEKHPGVGTPVAARAKSVPPSMVAIANRRKYTRNNIGREIGPDRGATKEKKVTKKQASKIRSHVLVNKQDVEFLNRLLGDEYGHRTSRTTSI